MAEPQEIEAADRYGYRALPQHHAILFRINAIYETYAELQAGELRMCVEYRGTDAELIAAGIVTAEFLVPRPGHRRCDKAGRWVRLERRLEGIRVATFYGDPLAAPRLQAISRELVNEAIKKLRNVVQVHEYRPHLFGALEPFTAEQKYLDAAEVPLEALARIAGHFCHLSPMFAGKLEQSIVWIRGMLKTERGRLLAESPSARVRPSHLRLVVDNEVRP
jgi:hypothetical protein